MKEQLISFETAKLAKEKGFDIKVPNVWYDNGVTKCRIVESNTLFDTEYYAPTQSLLQKWLREEHSIFVEVNTICTANEVLGHQVTLVSWKFPFNNLKSFYEYEEALEIGLQEALKLIK